MPGSWWCSQYLLGFKCPWWWWWCYAPPPPPPGNSNGVQDRVFKVPGNNVSNEDSGTQAPVTYNQQYQHPLQSRLYFRIQLWRRCECVKKAKWKYQVLLLDTCVDLCLVLPSLLPATIHEKFTIQIRLSYEIRAWSCNYSDTVLFNSVRWAVFMKYQTFLGHLI